MKYVKLGDICSKGVSSLRQKDTLPVGDYPVYGASGICGYLSDYQHNEPYVAVVKDGAGVGRVQLCSGKSSVLGTLQALLPKEEVNCEYLYEVVRSLNLGDGFTGSTIPHIYFKDYKNRTVVIYEKEQQTKITVLFSAVKNVIELHKLAISTCDKLVKSRFIEMFGDPCDSQRSTMSCCPIEKFCEVRIGPFGSALHKSDYVFGGHALVNPSHIVKGKIKINKKLAVNEEKYASMKAYHLKKGDVVLGRRGEIGRCAVVNQEGLLCGTGSMILRPDVHLCLSEYLQHIVSFPTFAEALERDAVGVTMKNLNAKIVENAVVVLPPMSLQREFISFVHQVDKLKFDFDFLVSFKIPSICLLCLELDP